MKQSIQLRLPGNEMQKIEFRTQAAIHFQGCRKLLGALHLKQAEVWDMLCQPNLYWKRVVKRSKSGKLRVCFSPSKSLRKIQKRIVKYFKNSPWRACRYEFTGKAEAVVELPRSFFPLTAFHRHHSSYEAKCSIVGNARYHRRNRSSLWLDIEGAFGSNKTKHLYRLLKLQFRYSSDAAWIFSRLLTYQGRIQQGSPASPYLFNLLMRKFVIGLAQKLNAPTDPARVLGSNSLRIRPHQGTVLTVYGDDICVSASTDEFPQRLEAIIREYLKQWPQFRINERKTRRGANGILEFPGVVIVNGRIRPQSGYIQDVARLVQTGTAPERVLNGHRWFLNQFGHSGRLKILRKLLAI